MWVRVQGSRRCERSRKEAPVYFCSANCNYFLSVSLICMNHRLFFSWKSVPRFIYLKLACHPPEADSTHPLHPLPSHGILDKCGGTCRKCHTSLSLAVPPLSSQGGSIMECRSLITAVLRTGQKYGIWEIDQDEFKPYSQRPCLD